MRERPIIFSGAMVRAILEGRKSQTRRVVKPQPADYPAMRPEPRGGRLWIFMAHSDRPSYQFATGDVSCPYGAAGGSRLWVRETWAANPHAGAAGQPAVFYRADGPVGGYPTDGPWRPSIFMPRWASRLLLEVTDVRVQRVQEISADDCVDEGIDPSSIPGVGSDDALRSAFTDLWDSINGKRAPWASNPWVWCVTFRRVEVPTP